MKRNLIALLTAIIVMLQCPVFVSAAELNPESIFDITVLTENGAPVPSADVYLFSKAKNETVSLRETGRNGNTIITYSPDITIPDCETVCYGDYIVYVEAEGFKPAMHYLTKMYSETYDYSNVNSKKIEIFLEEENQLSNAENRGSSKATEDTAFSIQAYQYCVETGKISKNNPLYILRPEDITEMQSLGYAVQQTRNYTQELIPNVKIPVGEFHANTRCDVKVIFEASDSVSISVAVKSAMGFSYSGSQSRNFLSRNEYDNFCANQTARKQVYYTRARFLHEVLVINSQGTTTETYSLERIMGGTETGTPTFCSKCNKSATLVRGGDFGNFIPVVDGSSVTLSALSEETVELEQKLSLSAINPDIGIDLELNVSRTHGTAISTKYTPVAGYSVLLYDYDGECNTWHATTD